MDILLNIVIGIFLIFGLLIVYESANSKKITHVIGGLCYVFASIIAFVLHSWLVLLLGYILAFTTRAFLGDPWRAYSELSSSREFKQISQVLAKPMVSFSEEEFENSEKSQIRLFSLAASDRELSRIMKEYGASVKTLQNIYDQLIIAGAGQRVGSVWVPAAGIATPYTLCFLLENMPSNDVPGDTKTQDEDIRRIAFHIIDWFETGAPLP